MKSSAKKVELAPYDDLFSTEESRQDAKLEKVREIPLSELHPFKNHPFKVKDECRLYKGVNWECSEVSSQLDALIADLDKTVRGVSVDDVFYDL